MDFKALRAKRNDKARSLIESSGGKVDSSDWTPSEPLNTEAKTGMRPISRRAFKTGGKVEGDEAKTNLSRSTRGFKETVGLANTNQKDANEEREGKKHVGGMKNGGRTAKQDGGMTTSLRPKPRPEDLMTKYKLDSIFRSGEAPPDEPRRPQRRPSAEEMEQQAALDRANASAESEGRDREMFGHKRGGMVEGSAKDKAEDKKLAKKHGMSMKEWEKSPEDKKHDAPKKSGGRMAKMDGGAASDDQPKGGTSFHVINKKTNKIVSKASTINGARSARDRRDNQYGSYVHKIVDADTGETRMKNGGKAEHEKGCTCKACGGAAMKKDGGGLYANINAKRERGAKMRDAGDKGAPSAKDFKDAAKTAKKDDDDRMARATGGRAGKGKTNIVINVMPHTANKPVSGIQPPMPPMPPVGGPPPMAPPSPPMHIPPGLGDAMAGAAGAGPMPPQGGPGPMPPMGRKSGGKVYPKMKYGAGSGLGRLEKIEEYGKNA